MSDLNRDLVSLDELYALRPAPETHDESEATEHFGGIHDDIIATMKDKGCTFAVACKRMTRAIVKANEADAKAVSRAQEKAAAKAQKELDAKRERLAAIGAEREKLAAELGQ